MLTKWHFHISVCCLGFVFIVTIFTSMRTNGHFYLPPLQIYYECGEFFDRESFLLHICSTYVILVDQFQNSWVGKFEWGMCLLQFFPNDMSRKLEALYFLDLEKYKML